MMESNSMSDSPRAAFLDFDDAPEFIWAIEVASSEFEIGNQHISGPAKTKPWDVCQMKVIDRT